MFFSVHERGLVPQIIGWQQWSQDYSGSRWYGAPFLPWWRQTLGLHWPPVAPPWPGLSSAMTVTYSQFGGLKPYLVLVAAASVCLIHIFIISFLSGSIWWSHRALSTCFMLIVKSKTTFVGAINIQLRSVPLNEEKWYLLGNGIIWPLPWKCALFMPCLCFFHFWPFLPQAGHFCCQR